ncbi:MAG: hypothetical protein IJO76_06870 [Clostridia bacterium]|nr:hypothetical protein [Clostridia bacterium]
MAKSAKKKSTAGQKLLSFALIATLLFYVGYQVYRSVFSEVTTEMAVMHSVYESIETEGLVFRSETLIPASSSGHAYYTIDNGTRVSKNSVIASVYKDAESGRIEEQIKQIQQQIDGLKEIQAEGTSGHVTLDIVNEQLNDTVYDLIHATEDGIFENLGQHRFSLLSLLSKKQLITNKSVDFSAKIARLETEKANLQKGLQSALSKITAPVAGYFADRVDGFETTLTTDVLAELTPSQLQKFFDSKPAVPSAGGKIVGGYEWYMACIVPESYYNVLGVGKSLTLRMSFVLDESIPVTVYACNKDGKGNLAVVFRCDYMSEELSTIRHEMVEIQMVEHTGLKVPKRAISVDENQQAGVFVRSGNIVTFRKIEQEYSEPADYVICKVIDENGYIKLYDDIIVEGRGLYDGKIVS